MYKFISENELNTFNFHDSYIKNISVHGDYVKWILRYVSVKKENKNNPYNVAMDTDEAVITFFGCNYMNGRKQYGYGQEEDLKDNSIEHINQIINRCDMSYGELSDNAIAFFEIIQADYLFTFNIEFKKVTIEWNEFNGESWT